MFALVVAGLLVASSIAAYAAIGKYQERPLDRQMFGAIDTFDRAGGIRPIAGWGPSDGLIVRAREGMVATLSVRDVVGGPVTFRVLAARLPDGDYKPLVPGEVTFDPQGTTQNAYSFTFTKFIGSGGGTYEVVLYAGNATAAPVTVTAGTFVVQFAARG
jgi:hypothetical protein